MSIVDDPAPLVSCIMPTSNRRAFVPMAIRAFTRQDYRERELIIVDDGADPVADLVPPDPQIRYLRHQQKASVGAKRNLACEQAKGSLIAHWDDDDWHAPWRLSYQIEALLKQQADLCGLDTLWFFDPLKNLGWQFRYAAHGRRWLAGGSFCYRRTLWERHRFANMFDGEDTQFVAGLNGARVMRLDRADFYLARIHGGNTNPKRPGGTYWYAAPVDTIRAMLGEDFGPFVACGEQSGPTQGRVSLATAAADRPREAPVKVNIGCADARSEEFLHVDDTPRPGAQQADLQQHRPWASGAGHPIRVTIGVHAAGGAENVAETLDYLRRNTNEPIELILLADGFDAACLPAAKDIACSGTPDERGAASCFNRLVAAAGDAEQLVFLEAGALVGPGWLGTLCGVLNADPAHGLAGPSTNRAWDLQQIFPHARERDIERTAAVAVARHGASWRGTEPLHSLADFCYAVRRPVIEAIGGANEAYGLGPCWEMDYTIRAVRAGFRAVWAQGAFVYRRPPTARRTANEAALFPRSRQLYQDRFCGLRLTGARSGYAEHCRGDDCRHFAPPSLIARERKTGGPERALAAASPLVSCIMPTSSDRADWMDQAIRYFQTQDYADRELIILDDGSVDRSAAMPSDTRVRYHRLPHKMSIGAKRNRACELARGEIVAHWDDDDWYAAERLSAQVAPLLRGEAEICGLTGTRFFDLNQWRFWACTPDLHRRLFVHDVHGGTLVYRRSVFERLARYPDASLAEDAAFLRAAVARGARLAAIEGSELFLYVRHAANTWALTCGQHIDPRGWRPINQPAALAPDRAFYASRTGARPPVAAEAPLVS